VTPAGRPREKAVFRLTLYVAGTAAHAATTEDHLRRICADRLAPDDCEITVVDVLEAVGEADAARILVTPTVIRTEPAPVLRVIGDLSATAELARALGLPDRGEP
jgi:circadian clock protein KaiB